MLGYKCKQHHWLRRLVQFVFAGMVALAASSGVAYAQVDGGDAAYAECRSRDYDRRAFYQILDDEKDKPDGLRVEDLGDYGDRSTVPDDKIQELKEGEFGARFEELHQQYESDQGMAARFNRTVASGNCNIAKPVNTAVNEASGFWEDPIGKFAKSVIEGNTQALEVAMTFWMDMDMSRSALEGTATGVSNIVWWLVIAAFIVNFIILGSRMAWTRRQGLADGLEDTGEMLWQIAFYTVLVPGAIFSIIAASDSLSRAILENFGATTAEDFLSGTSFGDSVAGPILMLAVAGLSFLGSLTQMLAMVARVLLLPLIIGLLPLFAGLSATEWGKAALNSAKNWLIALVLFKPIAALVYSVALWIHNMGGEGEDLLWTITRALVVAIAGFSVIGVAKIVVPMLSSMGGNNTAAVGAGAAAATGAVAAGAFGAAGALAGGAGKALAGVAARTSAPATGAKGTAGTAGNNSFSASGSTGSSGTATSAPSSAPQTGAGATGSGTAGSSVAGSSGGKQADAPAQAQPQADASTGGKGSQQPGQPMRPEKSGAGTSTGARRGAARTARAGARVANASAGGARIAQRISKSAGIGGSRSIHGINNAFSDSLGSPGHGGQINR